MAKEAKMNAKVLRVLNFVMFFSLVLGACTSTYNPEVTRTISAATHLTAETATPEPTSIVEIVPKEEVTPEPSIEEIASPTVIESTQEVIPTITMQILNQKYGFFVPLTLIDVGDIYLVKIGGEKYRMSQFLLETSGDYDIRWPGETVSSDITTGTLFIGTEYLCFHPGQIVSYVSSWISPTILEGKKIEGEVQSWCFDTVIQLHDNVDVVLPDMKLFDIQGDYAVGKIEGFFHIEDRAAWVTQQPRNTKNDARVMKWADELDDHGYLSGPISACDALQERWIEIHGLTPDLWEKMCGGHLKYIYRYLMRDFEQIGDYIVGYSEIPVPGANHSTSKRWIDSMKTILLESSVNADDGSTIIWVTKYGHEPQNFELVVPKNMYFFVVPADFFKFDELFKG
jgi:hypothetical protein